MSTMFDRIIKSPFLARMDHMSTLRKGFDMNAVVGEFDPKSNLTTLRLCEKYMVATTPDESSHVKEHWLGDGPNPWFTHPQNDAIIRRGLFEAVKQVRDKDLPLDVYWVCYPDGAVPKEHPIEVAYSINDRQITVILLTPSPPPSGGTADEPAMFITRFEDDPANPGQQTVVHRPVRR